MTAGFRMTPVFLHLMLSFSAGPRHGYAAMQEIAERTGGRIRLGPSSLYYSIGRLEAAGMLEEVTVEADGGEPHEERRRYYRMTAAGRTRLREEARALEDILAHARAHGVLR